jgi:hypothetical protein
MAGEPEPKCPEHGKMIVQGNQPYLAQKSRTPRKASEV